MKKIEIYSNPEADRLSAHYSIDIVDELTSLLSDQIAREIDRDILKSLGLEPDRNKRRINSINKIFRDVE
jgi:ABC-type Na+ transport system ATPase subunit NatA